MLTSQNGHAQCLKLLLKHKADPNLCKFDRQSPLMLAVMHARSECVMILLEAGADPNARTLNGVTALMMMVEFTHKIATGKTGNKDSKDSKSGGNCQDPAHQQQRKQVCYGVPCV